MYILVEAGFMAKEGQAMKQTTTTGKPQLAEDDPISQEILDEWAAFGEQLWMEHCHIQLELWPVYPEEDSGEDGNQ